MSRLSRWEDSEGRLVVDAGTVRAGGVDFPVITAGFWRVVAKTEAEERMGVGACTVLSTAGAASWRRSLQYGCQIGEFRGDEEDGDLPNPAVKARANG